MAEKIFSKNAKGSERKLASSSIPHENKKTRRAKRKVEAHELCATLHGTLISEQQISKVNRNTGATVFVFQLCMLPLNAGCSPRCCEDSRISSLAVALAACAHPEGKKKKKKPAVNFCEGS